MKKAFIGVFVFVSAFVCLATTNILWELNHGVMAFLNLWISGLFVCFSFFILYDKGTGSKTGAAVTALIAATISAVFLANNSTDYEAEKETAEKSRRESLTPEQRKQEDFEKERSLRGYILSEQIKAAAYDPDALKLKSPEYVNNGVCIQANGKNRFGGYVGWKEYCYLVDDKGVWYLRE